MNQLAPSVDKMLELIALGIDCNNASATYCMTSTGYKLIARPYLSFSSLFRRECCIPALTLSDILQMLPFKIDNYELSVHFGGDEPCVQYEDPETLLGLMYFYDKLPISAAYRALQHCAISGYIKTQYYDERPISGKCSTAR